MTITITDVRQAHPNYFSRENKRFFNDISYKVRHGKQSKQPYLVTYTFAWTDMFGETPRAHYRVKPIDKDTLDFGPLVDDIFWTETSLNVWLEEH